MKQTDDWDLPAIVDLAAERLRQLIEQVEAGEWLALLPLGLTLALTPGLWRRHTLLVMRAERVWLTALWEMTRRARRRHDSE